MRLALPRDGFIESFPVDLDIAQSEALHILQHVRFRHILEYAIRQMHIVDRIVTVTTKEQSICAFAARDIPDLYTADGRRITADVALFVNANACPHHSSA